MKNISDYIKSGIVEAYVLGLASVEEQAEFEALLESHPEVRTAADSFSEHLERETMANAITPDPLIKPMVMATVDYISRMESGEIPSTPPLLNENSTPADFEDWISRADMTLPASPENIYAKIIAFTPEATTAIVWIKELAPQEVHHDEHEKFLILEGTCSIVIENEVFNLAAGDYFSIPLHKGHRIDVTSTIPCKAILQRVAA